LKIKCTKFIHKPRKERQAGGSRKPHVGSSWRVKLERMRTENIYCDYCQKMTNSEDEKKESLKGCCVGVGNSLGGW